MTYPASTGSASPPSTTRRWPHIPRCTTTASSRTFCRCARVSRGAHSARKRTVDFTWHAEGPDENFSDVKFPGPLNECTACHVSGDNDFSSAGSAAAVPNMLPSTVAKGKYDRSPTTNPTGFFTISPYVVADNVFDYGTAFATNGTGKVLQPDGQSGNQLGRDTPCTPSDPCFCTPEEPCSVGGVTTGTKGGVPCSAGSICTCTTDAPCVGVTKACSVTDPCQAAPTTLVKSPIISACSACHDTPQAIDHFEAMGGKFYAPRSEVFAPDATKEECLLCHGPNKLGAIANVHQ